MKIAFGRHLHMAHGTRQPTHSLPLSTFIGSLSLSLPLSSSLFFLPLSTIISLGLNREEPLHAGREKSQPDNRHAVGEQTWMLKKDKPKYRADKRSLWLREVRSCSAWVHVSINSDDLDLRRGKRNRIEWRGFLTLNFVAKSKSLEVQAA